MEIIPGPGELVLKWPGNAPLELTAIAKNAAGRVLEGHTATWSSSDTSRIKVASIDKMKARASPLRFGTAIITVTVAGKSIQRDIRYRLDDVPLQLLPDTSVIVVGASRTLRVQRTDLGPSFAPSVVTVPGVRWETSDPVVAQVVDSTGEVTLVGEGHATITAEIESKRFTAEVFGFRYPGPLRFSSFSTGSTHACGITESEVAFCWGLNERGQLGNTGMMDKCVRHQSVGPGPGFQARSVRCTQTPVAVASPAPFVSISAGGETTCALTASGAAYCWGSNTNGMTGTGTSDTNVSVPLPVQGGISFRSIDVGALEVCGVTTTNEAYCWGAGTLGDGTTTTGSAVPRRVSGTHSWSVVRAGRTICGITTDGTGYCWGGNGSGQAGAAAGTQGCTATGILICPAPVRVSDNLRFTHIGSRGYPGDLSCGLATTGTAYCWGEKGLAGETSSVPVAVSGGPFKSLDGHWVCAVHVNGGVYCWDGYGIPPRPATPPAFDVTAFDVGESSMLRCATNSNGTLYCWDASAFSYFMWWGLGVIGSMLPLRIAGQP